MPYAKRKADWVNGTSNYVDESDLDAWESAIFDLRTGPVIYAEDYLAGGTDYGVAVSSALTAIAGNGTIILPGKNITSWTTPSLSAGATRVSIRGQHGTKVTLSAGYPRLFDLNFSAHDLTFQNIEIGGFEVDGGGIGGLHHVVFGNYINGTQQTWRFNADRIYIHDIKGSNVLTTDSIVAHRLWIWLYPFQTNVGDPLQTLTNITVERCDFRGGNIGVSMGGVNNAGDDQPTKVYFNNLRVEKVDWDGLIPRTANYSSGAFQFGSHGYGDRVRLTDCTGNQSGDIGVEIGAVRDFVGRGVTITNAYRTHFFHRRFNTTPDPRDIHIRWIGCRANVDANASAGCLNSHSGYRIYGGTLKGGNVSLTDCSYDYRAATLPLTALAGSVFSLDNSGDCASFTANGLHIGMNGWTYNSASNAALTLVHMLPANYPRVRLRGLSFQISGTRSGAGILDLACVDVRGNVEPEIEADFDIAITGCSAGTVKGFRLGVSAAILREPRFKAHVHQIGDDTNPRVFQIYGVATLAVTGRGTISNSDFSQVPAGGLGVFFVTANENKDKFFFDNNSWRVFPPATAVVAVPATTVALQHLDGYPSRYITQGGTVTKIEISADNATWVDVGVVAGSIMLENGEYIRWTYTVVPTVNKYPTR